jgi:hypothetical protein
MTKEQALQRKAELEAELKQVEKIIQHWSIHHEMFINESDDFFPADQVEWLDETAQSTSAGALVEALEKIAQMKREPGETTDTYAFNRCWHIATEALKQYSSK